MFLQTTDMLKRLVSWGCEDAVLVVLLGLGTENIG